MLCDPRIKYIFSKVGHLISWRAGSCWCASTNSGEVTLPEDNFPLECSDLTRNYPSGNITSEWGSMQLEYLSIDSNMFSGTIPHELGKLVNLKNLSLSANNLTGELPVALTKLIRLTELYLTSNFLNGPIPEFIKIGHNRFQIDLSYNNLSEHSAPPCRQKL
nr:isoform 2 of probable lrr receptor-like serine/threonine-protein kinase rfk1 [Quercus suber]